MPHTTATTRGRCHRYDLKECSGSLNMSHLWAQCAAFRTQHPLRQLPPGGMGYIIFVFTTLQFINTCTHAHAHTHTHTHTHHTRHTLYAYMYVHTCTRTTLTGVSERAPDILGPDDLHTLQRPGEDKALCWHYLQVSVCKYTLTPSRRVIVMWWYAVVMW